MSITTTDTDLITLLGRKLCSPALVIYLRSKTSIGATPTMFLNSLLSVGVNRASALSAGLDLIRLNLATAVNAGTLTLQWRRMPQSPNTAIADIISDRFRLSSYRLFFWKFLLFNNSARVTGGFSPCVPYTNLTTSEFYENLSRGEYVPNSWDANDNFIPEKNWWNIQYTQYTITWVVPPTLQTTKNELVYLRTIKLLQTRALVYFLRRFVGLNVPVTSAEILSWNLTLQECALSAISLFTQDYIGFSPDNWAGTTVEWIRQSLVSPTAYQAEKGLYKAEGLLMMQLLVENFPVNPVNQIINLDFIVNKYYVNPSKPMTVLEQRTLKCTLIRYLYKLQDLSILRFTYTSFTFIF